MIVNNTIQSVGGDIKNWMLEKLTIHDSINKKAMIQNERTKNGLLEVTHHYASGYGEYYTNDTLMNVFYSDFYIRCLKSQDDFEETHPCHYPNARYGSCDDY